MTFPSSFCAFFQEIPSFPAHIFLSQAQTLCEAAVPFDFWPDCFSNFLFPFSFTLKYRFFSPPTFPPGLPVQRFDTAYGTRFECQFPPCVATRTVSFVLFPGPLHSKFDGDPKRYSPFKAPIHQTRRVLLVFQQFSIPPPPLSLSPRRISTFPISVSTKAFLNFRA